MKAFLVSLLVVTLAFADNWAILVAGSNGYWNYRHQADVSHAYQILKTGGIPADHVITFMYDDVATDEDNPFPGELYNFPGDESPNVYDGVIVDYRGNNNNPENFIKVLLGDKSAGGKVLESTSDDNVFLFFSDHGSYNVLCWPNSDLMKDEFQSTLRTMHDRGMYKHFVLYIEACYSGSMGTDFPEDLNISIVTAANNHESSYGWYCGSEAIVKGESIGSCLGDEFSVFWMEDTDLGEQYTESLEEQWNRIREGVTMSHASRYGDVSFTSDVIGEYFGYPSVFKKLPKHQVSEAWDSRDNKLLYLRYKYLNTKGTEKKKYEALYLEELSLRQQIDRYFNSIAKSDHLYSAEVSPLKSTQCYKAGIAQLEGIFGRTDYQFKYYHVIANMCNENPMAFSAY